MKKNIILNKINNNYMTLQYLTFVLIIKIKNIFIKVQIQNNNKKKDFQNL
jgi:hypothetical protein